MISNQGSHIVCHLLTLHICDCRNFSYAEQDAALAMAKQNLVKEYAVVGLMDDMLGFFEVLEYLFPSMCKGAPHIYRKLNRMLYFLFKYVYQ